MAGSASADMVSAASAPATAASAAAFPLNMSLYHILPNQVIPVDGSADAGNLAGHIVLVINALTSGHLDGLGGSNQLILATV